MNIKIKKLSKQTKASITTIYRYAKRLGRLPTEKEINKIITHSKFKKEKKCLQFSN